MEPRTLVNTAESSVVDLLIFLTHALEDRLRKHPVYQHYENLSAVHTELNVHNGLIQENIWPHLTGHTLVGPDKINVRSPGLYVIDDKFLTEYGDIASVGAGEKNHSYTFFHLGNKLSGHAQIIHGGLLATILDELTCRLAFQNFHSKKGVTANLNINYFKPCYVDLYVLIKCTVVKKNGRKCIARGQVYLVDLDADYNGVSIPELVEDKLRLLTECECLVIEPKWVAELKNEQH